MSWRRCRRSTWWSWRGLRRCRRAWLTSAPGCARRRSGWRKGQGDDGPHPLRTAARMYLDLQEICLPGAAARVPLLPELLAIRGRGSAAARADRRAVARRSAAPALPSVGGGRAGPGSGQEACMKDTNQRLFLAIGIWLACVFGYYTFFAPKKVA